MPSTTVFQVPASARVAIEKMAHGNISHALIKIIRENADAVLIPYNNSPNRIGIVCGKDTLETLDAIVARNNLKSRNQAITLLIDLAYKQIASETPTEPDA